MIDLQPQQEGNRGNNLVHIQRAIWMPRNPTEQYTISTLSQPCSVQADLSLVAPEYHNDLHTKLQEMAHLQDELEQKGAADTRIYSTSGLLELAQELDNLKESVYDMIQRGEPTRMKAVDTLLEKSMRDSTRGHILVGTPKGPIYKAGFHSLDPNSMAESLGSCTKSVKRLCEKVLEHDSLDHEKLKQLEERGKQLIYRVHPSSPDVMLAPIADLYRARVVTHGDDKFEQTRRMVEAEFEVLWLKNYTESPKPTGLGLHGAAHYIVRVKGADETAPVMEIQVWSDMTNMDAVRDSYYMDREQYDGKATMSLPILNQ